MLLKKKECFLLVFEKLSQKRKPLFFFFAHIGFWTNKTCSKKKKTENQVSKIWLNLYIYIYIYIYQIMGETKKWCWCQIFFLFFFGHTLNSRLSPPPIRQFFFNLLLNNCFFFFLFCENFALSIVGRLHLKKISQMTRWSTHFWNR